MKTLVSALLVALALCASPAQAAITQVQKAAAVSNAVAFSGNVTAGNLLVVIAGPSAVITGVTDTLGSTWVKAAESVRGDNLLVISIWYVKNCAGGADTVTVANSFGSSFVHVAVAEYSGIDTTAPLDQHTAQENPLVNQTAFTSGSVTTTSASELLIGGVSNASGLSITWDTGWVEQYDDTTGGASRSMSWADQIVSSTGSYAASGSTSSAATQNEVGIATFIAGGAPPASTCTASFTLLGAGCR